MKTRKNGGIRYRYHAAIGFVLVLIMSSQSIVNLMFGVI
jgi:hypothetical protein